MKKLLILMRLLNICLTSQKNGLRKNDFGIFEKHIDEYKKGLANKSFLIFIKSIKTLVLFYWLNRNI